MTSALRKNGKIFLFPKLRMSVDLAIRASQEEIFRINCLIKSFYGVWTRNYGNSHPKIPFDFFRPFLLLVRVYFFVFAGCSDDINAKITKCVYYIHIINILCKLSYFVKRISPESIVLNDAFQNIIHQ